MQILKRKGNVEILKMTETEFEYHLSAHDKRGYFAALQDLILFLKKRKCGQAKFETQWPDLYKEQSIEIFMRIVEDKINELVNNE